MLYELMQKLNDRLWDEENPYYIEELYGLFNYISDGNDQDIEFDGSGLGLYDTFDADDTKTALEHIKEQLELRKQCLESALWGVCKEMENV
jgi:hypothetical protein